MFIITVGVGSVAAFVRVFCVMCDSSACPAIDLSPQIAPHRAATDPNNSPVTSVRNRPAVSVQSANTGLAILNLSPIFRLVLRLELRYLGVDADLVRIYQNIFHRENIWI